MDIDAGPKVMGDDGQFHATDEEVDLSNTPIEAWVALGLFWVVILLTLVAVFNSLNLAIVSGPFSAFTTQLFEYAPRLVGGLVLALVGWLVASVVRAVAQKLLDKSTLDEKLSEHADMAPMSEGLAGALFWLVILLFVPAVLGALDMEGLLDPLRTMVTQTLSMLPNALGALIIGGVGWIVATVLRNLTTNLSRTAGVDKLGGQAGLAESVRLSTVIGLLVFVAVFLTSLIAALDAQRTRVSTEFGALLAPRKGQAAPDALANYWRSLPEGSNAPLLAEAGFLDANGADQSLRDFAQSLGVKSLSDSARARLDRHRHLLQRDRRDPRQQAPA